MSLLTRLSLVNRLVVALLSIAVVIFGVVAITTLKQELIPSTTAPMAVVTATYPGPRRRSWPTRSPTRSSRRCRASPA